MTTRCVRSETSRPFRFPAGFAFLIALASAAPAGEPDTPRKPGSAFNYLEPEVKILVDAREILQGGRKDVIAAIWKPKHVPASRAPWLANGDRVLGLTIDGESRAYPMRFLIHHEMVNDVLGGVPVAPNY